MSAAIAGHDCAGADCIVCRGRGAVDELDLKAFGRVIVLRAHRGSSDVTLSVYRANDRGGRQLAYASGSCSEIRLREGAWGWELWIGRAAFDLDTAERGRVEQFLNTGHHLEGP